MENHTVSAGRCSTTDHTWETCLKWSKEGRAGSVLPPVSYCSEFVPENELPPCFRGVFSSPYGGHAGARPWRGSACGEAAGQLRLQNSHSGGKRAARSLADRVLAERIRRGTRAACEAPTFRVGYTYVSVPQFPAQ